MLEIPERSGWAAAEGIAPRDLTEGDGGSKEGRAESEETRKAAGGNWRRRRNGLARCSTLDEAQTDQRCSGWIPTSEGNGWSGGQWR